MLPREEVIYKNGQMKLNFTINSPAVALWNRKLPIHFPERKKKVAKNKPIIQQNVTLRLIT